MALIKLVLKKKSFLGLLGAFVFFISSLQSFASPSAEKPNALLSYSGMKMIDLGHHFIAELSKEAALWAEKEKEEDNAIVRFLTKKEDFSKNVVEGFVNIGQMMVYIGLSKEYENLLKHQNENIYIQTRIQIIQDRLIRLKQSLNERRLDDDWIDSLFDKNKLLTFESLGEKVKVFSSLFKNLNIYGVGFELVSDIPLGSLIGVLAKAPLVKNIANSASYQGAKGMLFFIEKDRDQERNVFVNSSFSHKGAQVKGSVLTGGSGKKGGEFNFSVQLTLFASTDELSNFRETNLNQTYITELNLSNELSEVLPEKVKGLVGKMFEGLDSLLHISFIKEKLKVTMGYITTTNEKNSENTPDVLMSFSIGQKNQSIVKGKKSWLDSSVALGFLSVDKIIR
jgi:hypothetical protein